jgi:hypothetical protein
LDFIFVFGTAVSRPTSKKTHLSRKPVPVETRDESSEESETEDTSVPVSFPSKYKPKSFHPKIEALKEIFLKVSTQDLLDLKLYNKLDASQMKVVDAIFNKRYRTELIASIKNQTEGELNTFQYLVPKRMDHCEKSSMSIRLSILREKFKESEYGDKRPKDLHDQINKALFRVYFDPCIDSEEMVEISKSGGQDDPRGSKEKKIPRRSAIFCMKKGLTKCWFRSISSKFLNHLVNIKPEEIKKYYFDRFMIKLDEIFGPKDNREYGLEESLDSYYDSMLKKIENKKFKLPLTSRELEHCDIKALKKISKLRRYTDSGETEDFKEKYGEAAYVEKLNAWRQESETAANSSINEK